MTDTVPISELEELVEEYSKKCDNALEEAKEGDVRALGEGSAYDIVAYDLSQLIEEHKHE